MSEMDQGNILFDGDMSQLVEGVFTCGADGMGFDYATDVVPILARYGRERIILGGPDIRLITTGNSEKVRQEVSKWAGLGEKYPGYVLFNSSGFTHRGGHPWIYFPPIFAETEE